jgi:hypothetical protein
MRLYVSEKTTFNGIEFSLMVLGGTKIRDLNFANSNKKLYDKI